MSLAELADPLHALPADKGALYVDWQARLGTDDVKPRLVSALGLSGARSAAVLHNFNVLAYEDDEGEWYDQQPLLRRVRRPGAGGP